MFAVDDGFFSGNFNFADFCYLLAVILFAIALIVRALARPMPVDTVMIAGGLTALALGFLVI